MHFSITKFGFNIKNKPTILVIKIIKLNIIEPDGSNLKARLCTCLCITMR